MNPPEYPQSNGSAEQQLFDKQRESTLQQFAAVLLRRKRVVLATLAAVFCLTAIYTFSVRPTYEASSMVFIDLRDGDNANPVFDVSGTASANKITNELEIMKSYGNAAAVACALLERKYIDAARTTIIPIIRADARDPQKDSLAIESTVAARVRSAVEFTPVRESDIIAITARSHDAKESALIANLYTTIYTLNNMTLNRTRSQARREFLENQVNSKRAQLNSTENDLQQYMRRTGIVALDAEANRSVEHLSSLEAQRDGLEVDKRTRQKTLASYQDELERQEPNAARAIAESNDSYIKLLQEQLGRLEVQRDVTIAQNPSMVQQKLYSDKLDEINGQINEIKRKLDIRTKQYLRSLQPTGTDLTNANSSFLGQLKGKIIEQQIELQGIDARITALNNVIGESERKFNDIPQKSMNLARRQRARLSTEKLYLLVEEKYNEAAIKEKSEFGNVNVVDQAVVPLVPVSPKVIPNLLLGLLGGLGAGIAVVLVMTMLDRYIRTPEDLKRCGFVPLSTISVMNGEMKKIEEDVAVCGGTARFFDPHLITHYRPLSPLSESYRHLRAKVQYGQGENAVRCIVVSSCNPKEGKTTTTANLAITFSQADKKVVLVDADMRRSSLHAVFGLRNAAGLNEYLLGRITIDEAIQKGVLPNLDIVTCGLIPPNPAEILGSVRMKEFIKQMRHRYDMVIFDAPPLLAVTDAAVLATESDGVLLVASSGDTHAAGLQHIAEFLTSVSVRLLGVVLNRFDAQKEYGGSYSSYASYHYGYYGYDLSLLKKLESGVPPPEPAKAEQSRWRRFQWIVKE